MPSSCGVRSRIVIAGAHAVPFELIEKVASTARETARSHGTAHDRLAAHPHSREPTSAPDRSEREVDRLGRSGRVDDQVCPAAGGLVLDELDRCVVQDRQRSHGPCEPEAVRISPAGHHDGRGTHRERTGREQDADRPGARR